MKNILLLIAILPVLFACEPSKVELEKKTLGSDDYPIYNVKLTDKTDLKPILLIGGSEGNVCCPKLAEAYAKAGYSAYSTAYFGVSDLDLPADLDQIPLEYFIQIIQLIRWDSQHKKPAIAVHGISRGAELALLLSTVTDKVEVVIATAPSSHVWSALSTNYLTNSSWTHKKKDIPFLICKRENQDMKNMGISITPAFRFAMKRDSIQTKDARIKIEESNSAIMLLSGGDDQLWPAEEFSIEIMKTLKAHNYDKNYAHLNYPKAGHIIGFKGEEYLGDQIETRYNSLPLNLGGTEEATINAQNDSWPKILKFLKENY